MKTIYRVAFVASDPMRDGYLAQQSGMRVFCHDRQTAEQALVDRTRMAQRAKIDFTDRTIASAGHFEIHAVQR